MKSEFYRRYIWPTKKAARLAVGDWVERVYNRRRRHSKLGMISPRRLRGSPHSAGTSRPTQMSVNELPVDVVPCFSQRPFYSWRCSVAF